MASVTIEALVQPYERSGYGQLDTDKEEIANFEKNYKNQKSASLKKIKKWEKETNKANKKKKKDPKKIQTVRENPNNTSSYIASSLVCLVAFHSN